MTYWRFVHHRARDQNRIFCVPNRRDGAGFEGGAIHDRCVELDLPSALKLRRALR
jgi:hypothetical protein